MRLQANQLSGVVALMLCSCATSDEPATTASTQQTTSTTSEQGPTEASTTSTTTTSTTPDTTQQPPAEMQSTTTQSTSTTSTTTPDESTTGPAAPAQSSTTTTTTTTTDQSAAPDQAVATAPATAADVKNGVSVFDSKGDLIGKIDSVSGENAVISTGKVKATVPISSFAKNDKGLVIGMTKAEFEAAAKEPQ